MAIEPGVVSPGCHTATRIAPGFVQAAIGSPTTGPAISGAITVPSSNIEPCPCSTIPAGMRRVRRARCDVAAS